MEIWKKPDLYNISGLTSYFLCRREEDTSLLVFCQPRVHYLKHRSHNDSTSTSVWLTLYQYYKQTLITWASTSRSPASVYFENTHFFKMVHFYNLQRFLRLLLCGLIIPFLNVKSSSNDSNSFPIVINTWAGNYKGATDKGDKTDDLNLNVK